MSRRCPADIPQIEDTTARTRNREEKEKNRKEKTTSKRTESVALLAQAGNAFMKILKSQVALRLFPEMSEKTESAVQHMRRWIKGDPELCEKLTKAGYKTRSKFMTKKQADLILYYLE